MKFRISRTGVFYAVFAALSSITAESASAEPRDSLCVHFTGKTKEIHVALKSGISMNGTLPVTFCNLERENKWEIEVDGYRLEKRRGRFGLDSAGNPFIKGRRLTTLLRNSILPGWGTICEGDRAEGWMDMAGIAAMAVFFYSEDSEYRDMRETYDDLLESLGQAETFEEKAGIREAAHIASIALNTQNNHRKRILWTGAALYGLQALDPLLLGGPPAWESQAGGSVMEIGRHGSNKLKAFALSLVKPGRGQFYQGKYARGIAYSALTAVAGYFALEKMNMYDEDADLYEVEVEKFKAAVSVEEKSYHKDRAEDLWDELQDSKRERNIALGCLAGSWIISIVDTYFYSGGGAGASNLTYEAGPAGGALVYRF